MRHSLHLISVSDSGTQVHTNHARSQNVQVCCTKAAASVHDSLLGAYRVQMMMTLADHPIAQPAQAISCRACLAASPSGVGADQAGAEAGGLLEPLQ